MEYCIYLEIRHIGVAIYNSSGILYLLTLYNWSVAIENKTVKTISVSQNTNDSELYTWLGFLGWLNDK